MELISNSGRVERGTRVMKTKEFELNSLPVKWQAHLHTHEFRLEGYSVAIFM